MLMAIPPEIRNILFCKDQGDFCWGFLLIDKASMEKIILFLTGNTVELPPINI